MLVFAIVNIAVVKARYSQCIWKLASFRETGDASALNNLSDTDPSLVSHHHAKFPSTCIRSTCARFEITAFSQSDALLLQGVLAKLISPHCL
jgi:hypothetical protein